MVRPAEDPSTEEIPLKLSLTPVPVTVPGLVAELPLTATVSPEDSPDRSSTLELPAAPPKVSPVVVPGWNVVGVVGVGTSLTVIIGNVV